MPEYFDISLIAEKTDTFKQKMKNCLFEKFGLVEGENEPKYFGNKKVIISIYEDEETDYDEICISFPEQTFHKESFEEEISIYTSFVNICFEYCHEVQFALCSYELNGYLLRNIKRINSFDDPFLSKFPITYERKDKNKQPCLRINIEAQNILI